MNEPTNTKGEDYLQGWERGIHDEVLQELQGGVVETGTAFASAGFREGYEDAREEYKHLLE